MKEETLRHFRRVRDEIRIVGLILQQALLIGGLGYAIAYYLGQWLFPAFPRRVVIIPQGLWMLAGVVVFTHDHRALDVFDRTLEMEDGRLRAPAAHHAG